MSSHPILLSQSCHFLTKLVQAVKRAFSFVLIGIMWARKKEGVRTGFFLENQNWSRNLELIDLKGYEGWSKDKAVTELRRIAFCQKEFTASPVWLQSLLRVIVFQSHGSLDAACTASQVPTSSKNHHICQWHHEGHRMRVDIDLLPRTKLQADVETGPTAVCLRPERPSK